MKKWFIHSLILLLVTPAVFAGGVYLQPADFIKQVFNNEPPKPSVLWLKKDLKKQLDDILDHRYKGMRVRYWQQADEIANRTAWILEETGKDKLITAGIVVNEGKIEQVKVLIFRESRGWEVRHDFFTDQFKQVTLAEDNRLSRHIDNISGATLSVRAIKKLAQIALLLDQTIQQKKP
ncbi:MAG: FMN-binding protein [Gammaproteobacteria bacterium]